MVNPRFADCLHILRLPADVRESRRAAGLAQLRRGLWSASSTCSRRPRAHKHGHFARVTIAEACPRRCPPRLGRAARCD